MKAPRVWNASMEIRLLDGRTVVAHFHVIEDALLKVAADVRANGLVIRPAEIASVTWTPPWTTPDEVGQ